MNDLILIIHVLSATIWVGGHLLMMFRYLPGVIRSNDISSLLEFESKYESMGKPALVLLIVTGFWMGLSYDDNPLHWFSFENEIYALLAVKTILLMITLISAIDAHTRIAKKEGTALIKSTVFHIRIVTVAAVLLLIAGVRLP